MSNHDDMLKRDSDASRDLPVEEAERLLATAPQEEALSEESRRRIWKTLEASLVEVRPEQVGTGEVRSYRPLPSPRRVRVAVLSVAALVMLLFGVGALLFERHHLFSQEANSLFARIDVVRGGCLLVSTDRTRQAGAGASVRAGESVRLSPEGGARLVLADGSLVWLCGGSEIQTVSARGTPGQPVFRLVRGEFRAEVVHLPEKPFTVETGGATLRVLGTQFNCRVLPAIEEENAAMKRFRKALDQALRSAVVLTVLSGAVEVQAAGVQEVVHGGERSVVAPGSAPSAGEKMGNPDFTANWLGEPGEQATTSPEALVTAPLREYLLHRLWAVNVDSGKTRHVTDLIGCFPQVVQQFGSGVALVKPSSVLFADLADSPIGRAGHPLVDDGLMLVNLKSGEKIPVSPLKGYDVRYCDLSPDHRKLAFLGRQKSGNTTGTEHGVFVLDLESLKVKLVLQGGMATCPHWSPDSRWLVISKGEGYSNNHRLVLIDTVMGEVRDTGLEGAGAVFSPDGRQLVFSGDFRESGGWAAGVPKYGNLLAADLPNGKPKPLTSLAAGGAVFPRFSPDGSQLAWWEVRKADNEDSLHVLDVSTGKDRKIAEGTPYEQPQWLDANSRILFRGQDAGAKGESAGAKGPQVVLADLSTSVPSVRRVSAQIAEKSPEQKAAVDVTADRLFSVFSIYRDAVKERDEHHLARAMELYGKTYATLQQLAESLQMTSAGLSLSADDFAPYLETFSKIASLGVPGLTARITRENLEWYIPSLLRMYVTQNGKLPSDASELARWALQTRWQIDHISSTESERAKALFRIPGIGGNDDATTISRAVPEQPTGTPVNPAASAPVERPKSDYRLVRSDEKEGVWVLTTPVMPGGKTIEATYRVKRVGNRHEVSVEIAEK